MCTNVEHKTSKNLCHLLLKHFFLTFQIETIQTSTSTHAIQMKRNEKKSTHTQNTNKIKKKKKMMIMKTKKKKKRTKNEAEQNFEVRSKRFFFSLLLRFNGFRICTFVCLSNCYWYYMYQCICVYCIK